MPQGTTLSTSATGNTVIEGESVRFTCDVTAAKPQVSRYRFYLNDTTLVRDSTDNRYIINNVQRSQHYGKYKCIPRNDVGNGSEAAVILNVTGENDHCLICVYCGIMSIFHYTCMVIYNAGCES